MFRSRSFGLKPVFDSLGDRKPQDSCEAAVLRSVCRIFGVSTYQKWNEEFHRNLSRPCAAEDFLQRQYSVELDVIYNSDCHVIVTSCLASNR
ncbi:hypothetical protein SAMN05443247_09428 [Bradyrhizobium erythrophlei]|nr:hypothetical protein SAMN05443247_09428 [Bradyrhizobium erythrophlei]